jgi:hypothetical protein
MNRTLTWSNTFGAQFSGSPTRNLDVSFGHDNEGGLTSTHYPTTYTASYSYTYGTMHRLSALTDQSTNSAVVSNGQYGPANERVADDELLWCVRDASVLSATEVDGAWGWIVLGRGGSGEHSVPVFAEPERRS